MPRVTTAPLPPHLEILSLNRSIYENIFTSLPVPEMLAYVGKSAVVAETDFAFSRNSLNCSSFHPGFFNKRAELDPVCDLSFATLPADANGNICGFAQIPEGTSLAGCRIRPSVQASFIPSPATAQFWGFQSQHIRVEVQGTRVSFYGIMRNGTVFRDEFVAIGTSTVALPLLQSWLMIVYYCFRFLWSQSAGGCSRASEYFGRRGRSRQIHYCGRNKPRNLEYKLKYHANFNKQYDFIFGHRGAEQPESQVRSHPKNTCHTAIRCHRLTESFPH
jgi:hypothetical protein